jgi:phosphoglucosamine mutase
MANKYFGTDGIRDVANSGNLTPERILRTAQGLGALLRETPSRERPRVGIAADTRVSCGMIFSALTAGLTSLGVDVVDFGVLPTPALAFLTRARTLAMGIMISASHNPMADNGIKVFHSDGFKLSEELERPVEMMIDGDAPEPSLPNGAGIGRVVGDSTGFNDYVASMVDRFAGGMLEGLTLAVDCANGAAWKTAPEILTRLGARINVMANAPNGTNINESCGSLHTGALRELVLAEGCDAGVALDGDADRSIFVDGAGEVRDGDAVMALMGMWLKAKGKLADDTVVATVMSNMGLEVALREKGIRLERTPVGDRHVSERLKAGAFSIGGEQSGHIIFGADNNYTGDGVYTALRVFQCMAETGRPLQELLSGVERYPQVLINVPVASTPPLDTLPSVMKRVGEAESVLGERGRVLLRYSGTEKKARVMTEGPDEALVTKLAESIAEAVRSEIG